MNALGLALPLPPLPPPAATAATDPASFPLARSRSPQCVCPGDAVLALPETGVVRIGGGLQQEGAVLVASKAGVVRQAPRTGKLWVEPRQKR